VNLKAEYRKVEQIILIIYPTKGIILQHLAAAMKA